MTDYISRDGLAEHKFQESELRGMGEGQAYRQGWNDAIDAIVDNEPAADVVEVVRCKDCENYQTDWQPLSFDDGHYCAMVDTTMPYDGFCHMGERARRWVII